MRFILICFLAVMAGNAYADQSQKDRYEFMDSMADIAIAEQFCGLEYNQQAISDYIAANVSADDKAFGSELRIRIDNLRSNISVEIKETSARTMYCTQQLRIAYRLGFISKEAVDGHVSSSF